MGIIRKLIFIDMTREQFYELAEACAESVFKFGDDPKEYWEWVDTKKDGIEPMERAHLNNGALVAKMSPPSFRKYAKMALWPERYGEIPDIVFDPNRKLKKVQKTKKSSEMKTQKPYHQRFIKAREALAEYEKRLKQEEAKEEPEPVDDEEDDTSAFELPIL